jgi:hypothetical protein
MNSQYILTVVILCLIVVFVVTQYMNDPLSVVVISALSIVILYSLHKMMVPVVHVKKHKEGFEMMRSDDLVSEVRSAIAGGLVKSGHFIERGGVVGDSPFQHVAGKIVIPANCPNLLIKQGERYHLHNTRKAEVPGINPITFDNLEDYTEFIKWQRMNGIRCPILSLQQTNEGEFIMNNNIPNVMDTIDLAQWSLLEDAGRTKGNVPSFDEQNQDIGLITPLDMLRRRGGNTSI